MPPYDALAGFDAFAAEETAFDRALGSRRARQRREGQGRYTFAGLTYEAPGALSWTGAQGWNGSPDGLSGDEQEAQLRVLGVTDSARPESFSGQAGVVYDQAPRSERSWWHGDNTGGGGLGFGIPSINLWLVLLVLLVLLALWLTS